MEYKLMQFKMDKALTRDQKNLIIAKVNSVRSFCPSDSKFMGEFSGKELHFSVRFAKGQFETKVTDASIPDMLDTLIKDIKTQIEAWRDIRFTDEYTGFTNFSDLVKEGAA